MNSMSTGTFDRTCHAARVVVAVAALATAAGVAHADNWPHWRGPDATGASAEKGLPVKWSDTENVVWKLAMPARSGATPIIWDRHIFLNVGDGTDLWLWAVDRDAGTVLWKQKVGGDNITTRKQNMSSPSPVTDGKRVWVLTGTGVVKAFDFSGKELWMRDVVAPGREGDYEYVCTYPGHWEMMWGTLVVTRDVDAYLQKHPVAKPQPTSGTHEHGGHGK